ncbi:DUF1499 domain-containing protein [Vibrio sp. 188UL20-2]|uniref:DUF1499 domain-containing protein n=1 Tax=Vibrio ulleungensis TaxID=2807619 RepID=A0ABS2HLD2_9VIBR|nr:DUF1499 domain-containing protein [Vibrio ulleungensis]
MVLLISAGAVFAFINDVLVVVSESSRGRRVDMRSVPRVRRGEQEAKRYLVLMV